MTRGGSSSFCGKSCQISLMKTVTGKRENGNCTNRDRSRNSLQIVSCLAASLLIGLCLSSIGPVGGDDSAAAPAFDMNALASLASNLGSNPQIMSLVTSFLNPNSGGAPKPAFGVASGANSIASDMGSTSDMEPNSIVPIGSEPLRRGMRSGLDQAQQQTNVQTLAASQSSNQAAPNSAAANTQTGQSSATATTTTSSAAAAPAPAGSGNPLGGLMSMLPGIMSGLSNGGGGGGGGGGLSGLAGLLSGFTKPQTSGGGGSAASAEQATVSSSASGGSNNVAAGATASATTATGANPAQSVINQVLTAYAMGQIPNELIQLSLSGRVPPQIIELALSGQVPSQMIQMIITGQVPMSTINSFLSAMQSGRPADGSTAAASSAVANGAAASSSSSSSSSSPGVFSTTRTLFENMFGLNRRNGARPSITVPTMLGPIPLRMPSMPNMRSFGQLVGGTISNVASMIPF